MMNTTLSKVGAVAALWRYPIKSMLGEELNATIVMGGALLGDRAFALIDTETGKVVSAKNPRKWPNLFRFRASFSATPDPETPLPSVRVTLPDGRTVLTTQSDFDQVVSEVLQRHVTLGQATLSDPQLEEYWPAFEGNAHNDVVTDEAMPASTFFDLAPIHILTTSTINRLRSIYPAGRFEVRRFRPNIVVQSDGEDFLENTWVDHHLAIGDEVLLKITSDCPRCVMTTLSQGDLPNDIGILRTAAQHNQAHVGVYAEVVHGGTIHHGDLLRLA